VPENAPSTLTPSQLNRDVRRLLESHFTFVWVEGEVSNFARPSSGHWYFTLKDDSAQVRCAMFRNRNQRVRTTPANGDLVRLRARVSLYEGRGEFQLIGEFLEPAGTGLLQARFDALRERLRAEGLFDSDRKRPLPTQVRHLAVVTSPTGAALQDILQVLGRRDPGIRVSVLPSPVQGEDAAGTLCRAIATANRLREQGPNCDFDALILARGGGSLEDLWAFNDEALARAITASRLPVVVGVGHEVDFTIADFAADQRAPTPSAAAEILSEDRSDQAARLARDGLRLQRTMTARLRRERQQVTHLGARLRHPGEGLNDQAQRLDDIEVRLRRLARRRVADARRELQTLGLRLHRASPTPRVKTAALHMTRLRRNLNGGARRALESARATTERQGAVLTSLNPLAVLSRGYAIVTNREGTIVRSARETQRQERLSLRLAQGELEVTVDKISRS